MIITYRPFDQRITILNEADKSEYQFLKYRRWWFIVNFCCCCCCFVRFPLLFFFKQKEGRRGEGRKAEKIRCVVEESKSIEPASLRDGFRIRLVSLGSCHRYRIGFFLFLNFILPTLSTFPYLPSFLVFGWNKRNSLVTKVFLRERETGAAGPGAQRGGAQKLIFFYLIFRLIRSRQIAAAAAAVVVTVKWRTRIEYEVYGETEVKIKRSLSCLTRPWERERERDRERHKERDRERETELRMSRKSDVSQTERKRRRSLWLDLMETLDILLVDSLPSFFFSTDQDFVTAR